MNRRARGLRAQEPRAWPTSGCYDFKYRSQSLRVALTTGRVAFVLHLRLGVHSVIVYAVICYNAPCRTRRMRWPAPWHRQSVKRRPVARITTTTEAGPSGGDGAASPHRPEAPARDLRANRPILRVWSIAAAVNHDAFRVDLDASPLGMRHAQSRIQPAATPRLTHMSHAQGRIPRAVALG